MTITADPRPQFRCRCVHRERFLAGLEHLLPTNPYTDRCRARPTQEDGLCDHCRQDEGCPCCAPAATGSNNGSCRWHDSDRILVDLLEPCAALDIPARSGL